MEVAWRLFAAPGSRRAVCEQSTTEGFVPLGALLSTAALTHAQVSVRSLQGLIHVDFDLSRPHLARQIHPPVVGQ